MFTISKEFRFEAAHHLEGLPEGHHCARPHGHSYTVVVALEAEELDATGFVVDFGDLAPFDDLLRETLDHQDLNEVLPVQPSSELLALHLYQWCQKNLPERIGSRIAGVAVSETAKTWAEYRP